VPFFIFASEKIIIQILQYNYLQYHIFNIYFVTSPGNMSVSYLWHRCQATNASEIYYRSDVAIHTFDQ